MQEQQRQQAWHQQRGQQQAPQQQVRGRRRVRERGQEPALLFYRKQPGQQQR